MNLVVSGIDVESGHASASAPRSGVAFESAGAGLRAAASESTEAGECARSRRSTGSSVSGCWTEKMS